MEDVLEVYQRPYDGNEALVCMDETSKQQVKETRASRPAAPGAVPTYDYEYERNGVSSLFMLFAPLDGWRRVEVRERRTIGCEMADAADKSGVDGTIRVTKPSPRGAHVVED